MTNALQIERLETEFLVARDHPAPHRLRADMDSLARKYITDSCARALDAVLDPNDPSVWVIRDVSLNLVVDVHAHQPDAIADFWASRIAAAVAAVIRAGEDGDAVLRFPNRAAYLAHFLECVAEDCAWTKWYFSEFDGLQSLPASTALREALVREPETAEAALLHLLGRGRLTKVVETLSIHDQFLVMGCCAGGSEDSTDALRLLLPLAPVSLRELNAPLSAYVRARERFTHLRAAQIMASLNHLARLQQWSDSGKLRDVIDAMARSVDLPDAATLSDQATLRALKSVHAIDPHLVLSLSTNLPAREDRDLHADRQSGLGGLFLLLPTLLEVPELLAIFGRPESADLRYLLFVKCFVRQWRDAWREHALLLAAGLGEIPGERDLDPLQTVGCPESLLALALPEDVAAFRDFTDDLMPGCMPSAQLALLLSTAAAILFRRFAQRLPALGGVSVDYLWKNILAGDASLHAQAHGVRVLLRDRPLQIVLKMAGLGALKYEVPWLPARSITVRFQEPS